MNKTDMLGLTILVICIIYVIVIFIYAEIEVYMERDPIEWLLGFGEKNE
jgi:hypothetical protein